MEWLKELFVEHSALQAVVVVSLISTIGIGLGKIRFFGISLGTAFIFFVGILAGHFGLSLDPAMLTYAESFGLVIFVYALGLQVGPGFFSSMRADGLRLVSPAIAIVLLGTALAMAMSYAFGVSMPDMSGILCGATTHTPALGETKDWNTENIDWNSVDSQLISQRILVTRPEINGKKLSQLRLRNTYGINISRVYRSGVQLLATPDLRLQLGDRLTVVGEAEAIRNVEKILGNAVKSLNEPNLAAVFIGLILGLTLGSIPVAIPGISIPVKLGLAGGPIIVGILIGTFGPRLHMITYTTQSANLMLRALGLSMYLACLGLDAGTHFFETVMRPEGALWLGIGFALTFVPVVLVGLFALRVLKVDFGSVSGLLCGSMANPMALNYVNDTIEGDNPSVSYATVYPVCMFLRVIIIQVMLMLVL